MNRDQLNGTRSPNGRKRNPQQGGLAEIIGEGENR